MLCGCQGTVHPYVNNCLNCGRIACEIEGDGDCYHCGSRIEWHPPTEGKMKGKEGKREE